MGDGVGDGVVNDLSARAFQFGRGGTWDQGKGCHPFGPVGPWRVTADAVPDPQRLALWREVNGPRSQDGNTASMVFGVAHLVRYIRCLCTLHQGELIATGTPAGVGMGHTPQSIYLKPGDKIRAGFQGLGEQNQTVHAWNLALIDG